jgi:hypothetical protein
MLLNKPRLPGSLTGTHASALPPLRVFRSHKLAHVGPRSGCIVRAQQLASFQEIKNEADEAFSRASALLPALEEAQRIAHDAREPAAEAERVWQDAHNRLADVMGQAHSTITELRDGAETALGGGNNVTADMLRHHATYRLDSFKETLSQGGDVALYKRFKPDLQQLSWLPGAALITQSAACISDDVPYLLACISIAMPPLHDDLRSMLLHWSLSDSPGAAWANSIPQGWHTSPGVSQPCGLTAWQTNFGPYAPVIEGQAASSATVFSVVVQIPLEGFLEERGGLKFVLKRSDGGQPEWIKPGNNADFWVDFAEPIALYTKIKMESEKIEKATQASALAAASAEALTSTITSTTTTEEKEGGEEAVKPTTFTEEDLSTIAVDSLDAWGWARAMALSSRDIIGSSSGESSSGEEEEGNNDNNSLAAMNTENNADLGTSSNTTVVDEKEEEKEEEEEDVQPTGWLAAVSSWEAIGDYPAQPSFSLSKQVQQLRLILSAAQHHVHTTENENTSSPTALTTFEIETEKEKQAQRAQQVAALLSRCHEVDETLQTYDTASLEARRAQQEKERLWEMHKTASDEATRLAIEVNAAVESARRHAAALRGRSAEVTQRDLESVASQMAESSGNGDSSSGSFWPFSAFGSGESCRRKVAFVSQNIAQIAGLDATMLMQVYLEGNAKDVQAALSGTATYSSATGTVNTPSGNESDESGSASESDTSSTSSPKKPPPAFDTIVISVCVAESFPSPNTFGGPAAAAAGGGSGGLRPPVLLHFGAVPHQHGKWRAPPQGWRSQPSEGSIEGSPAPAAPGTLPWVPLQQFAITRKDGSPAFVDPIMHGACVRLPLAEVALSGIRGLEFVLKTTEDGNWLVPAGGQGGNFYVEIPLVSGN